MNRLVRFRLILPLLVLSGAIAPSLPAQTATPSDKDAAAATTPADSAKKRPRVVSNEVAAALAATMPKYDPPKSVASKTEEEEEELADLRDTDKPRNKIIRLPEHVVREKKPPVFNQADVRDKLNYARSRFAGLGVSGGNNAIASDMLWEEERLKSKTDFADLARTGSVDDPEAKRYYKKLLNDTYVQPSESAFLPSAVQPSAAERASR